MGLQNFFTITLVDSNSVHQFWRNLTAALFLQNYDRGTFWKLEKEF